MEIALLCKLRLHYVTALCAAPELEFSFLYDLIFI